MMSRQPAIQGVELGITSYGGKRVLLFRQKHLLIFVPVAFARRVADRIHDVCDEADV